jgi:outer membrane protein OmpA-like peptidoglycan-associated protein
MVKAKTVCKLSTLIICAALLSVAGCRSKKFVATNDVRIHTEIVGLAAPFGGKVGIYINNIMTKQKDTLAIVFGGEATVEAVNRGEALRLTFGAASLFEANSNTIGSAAEDMLARLASYFDEHQEVSILIVGHTDRTGVAEYNSALSLRRAWSVYNRLATAGIASSRMVYEGRGGSEPAGDNATEEGRTRNRRIELFIVPGLEMIEAARVINEK